MSKKNIPATEIVDGASPVVAAVSYTHVLDAVKTVAGGIEPSLRAFALALDIPAARLYAVAKKPVAGQVYDPEARNWDALNEFFIGKLTAGSEDSAYASMEDLVAMAAEKDNWLKENSVRNVSAGTSNLVEVDGEMIPKRKSAKFDMGNDQESLLCFKHDAVVYKMVYQTESFTVVRPVAKDGAFTSNELRVLSNATINTKCVPPTTLSKAIEDRFSGAYAEQTATDSKSEDANQTAIEGV